jgi:hypothetical protein
MLVTAKIPIIIETTASLSTIRASWTTCAMRETEIVTHEKVLLYAEYLLELSSMK